MTTPFLPPPFIGRFWFNTRYSVYQVTIKDLVSSPEIKKMRVHYTTGPDGRPLVNPVGGVFRKGLFVGIGKGVVAKYDLPRDHSSADPIPTLETKGIVLGSRTTSHPIAFFLRRDNCDDCFEKFASPDAPVQAFDPRWSVDTIATLNTLGLRHPCVTIATSGRYALPRHILDCLA